MGGWSKLVALLVISVSPILPSPSLPSTTFHELAGCSAAWRSEASIPPTRFDLRLRLRGGEEGRRRSIESREPVRRNGERQAKKGGSPIKQENGTSIAPSSTGWLQDFRPFEMLLRLGYPDISIPAGIQRRNMTWDETDDVMKVSCQLL